MTINVFAVYRLRLWLAALLIALPAMALAQGTTGVGFQSITIHDPVTGGTMPGYVFYPSAQASGITWVGPYELHASRRAPAIPGAKPLVVISHGHGGSDLGHHDLAVYLASHGFVVATLQHPKDNYKDASGNGKAVVMDGRPIQVQATITMLLHDAHWKALIDRQRIGVAGFSNGGYTALMVVGAVPRFDRLPAYCKCHPRDVPVCADMVDKLKAAGILKKRRVSLQDRVYKWGNPHDSRVKAAFVMAPFSIVFDKAGLASIDRSVFLYYGEDDHVLMPSENVLHIAPLIKTLAGIKMIPKAGHYVFLSPCSPRLAQSAPRICSDPPGVDRAKVHAQINATRWRSFARRWRPLRIEDRW